MRKCVISAVNITEAGPAVILRSFAKEFVKGGLKNNIEAIFIVNSTFNCPEIIDKALIYDWPRKNFVYRLFFEYIYLYFLSLKLKPDAWISLNDVSPNVSAKFRVVYCHNPSPFFKPRRVEYITRLSFVLRGFLYNEVYRFNINKNSLVIVQSQWFKDEFIRRFNLKNVVVSRPIKFKEIDGISNEHEASNESFVFFYPAYPRFFKNVEFLLSCAEELNFKRNFNFKLILTFDGSENGYSKSLIKRYGHLENVDFIGFKTHRDVLAILKKCDLVIFPSRLETWGLPLSEARTLGKTVFAADLPYSREVLSGYNRVKFFNINEKMVLFNLLVEYMSGTLAYSDIDENTELLESSFDGFDKLATLLCEQIK